MYAKIAAVGSYVPENRVTNDDLARKMETSDEWIQSHTGIKARHLADPGQAASDLGYNAGKLALERSGIAPEDLQMIIVATASPDYIGFPSTAALIQQKLGAVNSGAMDLTAACTGFVYGLANAKGLIATGVVKNVLVIGCEVLSRFVDWEDRNTCVLFGDGAGAAVLVPSEKSEDGDIMSSILMADGTGSDFLKLKDGGSRFPIREETKDERYPYITMNGRKVYNFAVGVNVEIINRLLKENNLTIEDIAYIVPHQANSRIIEAAAKRLKIPIEKFFINIYDYANTSAATIPIAINEMNEKGLLKKGDLLLTVGFGGGLTYGGNLIRW